MLEKITNLLGINNLKSNWRKKSANMLKDKIDLSSFLLWLLNEFPDSIEIIRKENSFQDRFK